LIEATYGKLLTSIGNG